MDSLGVSVSRGSEMLVVLMHHSVGGAIVGITASAGRALENALHVDSRVIAQQIARRVSRDLHHLHYHLQFLFSRSHLKDYFGRTCSFKQYH